MDTQRSLFDKNAAEVADILLELNRALEKARRRINDVRARR